MQVRPPPAPTEAPCAARHGPALWISLALALVAFAPTVVRLVRAWWENPEYSHGFLMPLIAAWFVRQRGETIRALTPGASTLALPLLAICILAMLMGELDFMESLAPFAFIGALAAVVLGFLGWPGVRAFLPALVVLLLACPLPGAVQHEVTLPLKAISSRFAVGLLEITGIAAFLEGTMIHLEGADSLWVADACSGIRSFISLLCVAIVAAMVWRRQWFVKGLVVLAAIPIAVLANGVRIWLTGYLSVHAGPEAAEGVFHFFEGFALFALAGLLLLGFAALLGVLIPRTSA